MDRHFRLGQKVRVASGNDNDGYDSFRDKVLKIVHIDKEFDPQGGWLYSFKDLKGNDIGNSLYEWELEDA
jgi:hypothetical protein